VVRVETGRYPDDPAAGQGNIQGDGAGDDLDGDEHRVGGLSASGVTSGDLLPSVGERGRRDAFPLAERADLQAAGLPAGQSLPPQSLAVRIGTAGRHEGILRG
jgi:hypothetical protein